MWESGQTWTWNSVFCAEMCTINHCHRLWFQTIISNNGSTNIANVYNYFELNKYIVVDIYTMPMQLVAFQIGFYGHVPIEWWDTRHKAKYNSLNFVRVIGVTLNENIQTDRIDRWSYFLRNAYLTSNRGPECVNIIIGKALILISDSDMHDFDLLRFEE